MSPGAICLQVVCLHWRTSSLSESSNPVKIQVTLTCLSAALDMYALAVTPLQPYWLAEVDHGC